MSTHLFQLKVMLGASEVEAYCDALEALDSLSIGIEDADANTEDEIALFGEPGLAPESAHWGRSWVVALFQTEQAAKEAYRLLLAQDFAKEAQHWQIDEVPQQDWVRLTQAQFEPVEITPSFWIVPTWHEQPKQAQHILRLDPGVAFGTGTHPTTQMCLRWIASHPWAAGHRVLDYGCGSGILALAAYQFGARNIEALDIDPAAVEATQLNAKANKVMLDAGLPERASGVYDVVIANILASPLKVLAPLLCSYLRPSEGKLIMAGILKRQEKELKEAYAPFVQLTVLDEQEGWILMGQE